MTDAQWTALLDAATVTPPVTTRALTFLKAWPSYSRPAAISCDDGHVYIAKGRPGIERSIVAERIVGYLAVLLNAPVPAVMLIDIEDLRVAEPQMVDFAQGRLAHGSRDAGEPCSDRMGLQHGFAVENRARFAALCVLYSWCLSSDQQVIYGNAFPNLVYSVDHGHFFAGGPQWTIPTLQGAPPAVQDAFFAALNLTDAEMRDARRRLLVVGPDQIAAAVAAPPADWGVALQERIVLAEYLLQRKNQLDAAWAGLI
jgi:hypothetical protein